jgi:hypothetical protein
VPASSLLKRATPSTEDIENNESEQQIEKTNKYTLLLFSAPKFLKGKFHLLG